jgi:hypothetical protein
MPSNAPAAPSASPSLEAYARQKAQSLGIDPDTAVRVAKTEGGFDDPTRQNMQGAPAYGPYQLYVGGPSNPGLGDEALQRGIDPRNPAHAQRAVDFALEHAAKNGWGAFQGAAANGIGNWEGIGQTPARPQPTTPPQTEQTPAAQSQYKPGSFTPNQIDAATSEGLDYETALAVCGPAAAIAFARKNGRSPTMQEALGLAKQVGWTVDAGMAGPQSERNLLTSMGVASRLVDGSPDWNAVAADVQRGNPVIISTPGHYFVAERYDPQTGRFDFGNSAAILRKAGGQTWFTPDEMAQLGMGAPRASLFMDSPSSPAPSVVAGGSASSASSPNPTATTTPQQSQLSSSTSSPDQPMNYRLPLQPSSSRGIVPDPLTPPDPSQPDPEASRRDVQGMDPVGYPGSNTSYPYMSPGQEDWPIEQPGPAPTFPQLGVPPGTMLRQPLQANPGDAYPLNDASGAPLDASTPSPASDASPPSGAGAFQDDQTQSGWNPPAAPMSQQIPNEDQTQFSNGTGATQGPTQPSDGPSPLKPLYDLGGRIIGYVHDAAPALSNALDAAHLPNPITAAGMLPGAASTVAQEGIATPIARSISNPIREALGKAPEPDTGQPETPIDRALVTTGRSIGQDVSNLGQGMREGGWAGVADAGLGAIGLVGDLAPTTTLARQLNEMFPKADVPQLGEVGVGDVVMGAQLAHDAARLGYGAIKNGGKVWSKIAEAIQAGVPAERFSEWANRAAGAIDSGIDAARSGLAPSAGRLAPELANALPDAAGAVATEAPTLGPALSAAVRAAPARGIVGAGAGGLTGAAAGYESSPEDASPGETAARTAAGGLIGATAGGTIGSAGTLAAGHLIDSLVSRGAIDARVLASHPATADRIRALFSLAAEGLPDNATVQVPDMVSAMLRMRPQVGRQVADLVSGPVTAGEVRQIVGAADSPGVAQTVQGMVVDALTGLGAVGRRARETAADTATIRGISEEAAATTRGRIASTDPTFETRDGVGHLVDPEQQPNLTTFVNGVADKLGVARPPIYVIDSPNINASATTRSQGTNALILTRGLLNAPLTVDEMTALLTHELAHTAQDSRGVVGRAFGAVRDAVGSAMGQGARDVAGALPGGGQSPVNLPPQVQQAVRQAKAQQQQPGLSPLQWTRKFIGTVGYSSMIGPATFSVNVLGNLMEPVWAIPKEGARAIVRGNPREFADMAGGAFHGMGQAGAAMVDALAGRGKYANPNALSAQTANPIGKAITTGLEFGGRVFSALPDAVFGTIATGAGEARTAAQMATDMGLKGNAWKQHVSQLLADVEQVKAGQLPSMAGTQDVIDGGIAYAKRQTFQDDLGTIGKKARTFATVGDMPVVGNLVTPFFNTPWNMNTRMLERTPVGFAMNSQGSRFDRLYDATVGSALLIGLAAGPVAAGTITGGGPDDPQKKAEMRSQGWRPYSTLVDGVYVPNRAFGIYAPLLNAAADVHDSIAYAKDKSPASIASDYAGRLGAQIQQQPYLQGISNIMQTIQAGQGGGLGNAAEQFASSTLTRMVPYAATGRALGTAMDPNERTVDRGKNVPAGTTIGQQVQQGVGLRSGLPIAQDVLGRPESNPQQGAGAAFAKTSLEKTDPTVKAFLDAGVDIPFPHQQITVGGSTLPIDEQERRRWSEVRGDALLNLIGPMAQDGALDRMPSGVRQQVLQQFLQSAADQADARVFSEMAPADRAQRIRDAVNTKLQKAS